MIVVINYLNVSLSQVELIFGQNDGQGVQKILVFGSQTEDDLKFN